MFAPYTRIRYAHAAQRPQYDTRVVKQSANVFRQFVSHYTRTPFSFVRTLVVLVKLLYV